MLISLVHKSKFLVDVSFDELRSIKNNEVLSSFDEFWNVFLLYSDRHNDRRENKW